MWIVLLLWGSCRCLAACFVSVPTRRLRFAVQQWPSEAPQLRSQLLLSQLRARDLKARGVKDGEQLLRIPRSRPAAALAAYVGVRGSTGT